MGKNQHVTPHKDGGWQVKGENNTRATIRTDTQAEAIQRAREIARNQESELFIHGRDGRIRERDFFTGILIDNLAYIYNDLRNPVAVFCAAKIFRRVNQRPSHHNGCRHAENQPIPFPCNMHLL